MNQDFTPATPSNTEPLKPQTPRWIYLAVLLLVLSFATGYFAYLQYRTSTQDTDLSTLEVPPVELADSSSPQSSSPIPTPTLFIKPLPTGPQTYVFSHGELVQGPKPSQAVIDPIDPRTGDSQTLSITVKHNTAVTSGKITVRTDSKQKALDLKLVSGDASSGVWQATWTADDTYIHVYSIDISLSDNSQSFVGGLAFR